MGVNIKYNFKLPSVPWDNTKTIALPDDIKQIIKMMPKALQERIMACMLISYMKQVGTKEFDLSDLNNDIHSVLKETMEKSGRMVHYVDHK